jgi:hypothetical protein
MPNTIKPAIIRILTLLILFATAANAQNQAEESPPSENLLENGSFEDALAGDDLPFQWSNWSADDGSKDRSEVITEEETGKKCLKIEGDCIRGGVFTNSVIIDRNRRYALRGRVRIQGEEAARARIPFNYFHGNKWLGLPHPFFHSPKSEFLAAQPHENFPTSDLDRHFSIGSRRGAGFILGG